MKWLGHHIIDSKAWFRGLFRIGSSKDNSLGITPEYNVDKSLNKIIFDTTTSSSSSDRGAYRFEVDSVQICSIGDNGLVIQNAYHILDLIDTAQGGTTSDGGVLRFTADNDGPVSDNEYIGRIQFRGARDSSNNRSVGAAIYGKAEEDWTAGERAASLFFETTTGTTESLVLKLGHDKIATFSGKILGGNSGAEILNQTASAATTGGLLRLTCDDGAVMASGHRLGVIEFAGADNTSGNHLIGARIQAMAEATWEAEVETGGRLEFYTTDAYDTQSLVLTLDSDKRAVFTGSISLDSVAISRVQTSAESFVDNDTSFMTSAAIDDRIAVTAAALITAEDLDVAADSGTAAVDLNSQSLTVTGGTGITTSATGQAVTLNVDATQPGIESIGTDGDTLTILSDIVRLDNATNNTPLLEIYNDGDTALAGQMRFWKTRGAAGEDNDVLGSINWIGYNDAGTPENTQFASIISTIHDATDGEESGRLSFQVANHDGGLGDGLILTGGSVDDEIDVTLGLGAASVVTIPGDLTVNGDTVKFESANAYDPTVSIKNTTADAQGARLQMRKDRGAAMVQGDRVGEIDFIGEDAGESQQQYAKIMVRADVVIEGQESGQMVFQVANHDGVLEAGFTLEGGDEDGEIDATLGLGANSVVTIPGDLTVAGSVIGQLAILRSTVFYVNDNPFVQNNLYFGNSTGSSSSNWNDPAPVGGVIGDTSSFAIAGDDEKWGIVLPFNISKVEVQCSIRPQLGTTDDFTVAIYTGVRSTDSSADLTLTKVAHNSVALSGTANRYTPNDVSVTADYNAGTMIYVGVGSEDNTDAKNGQGYMNITVTRR